MPDGSYTPYTWLIDCWTPAGMLSMNLTDSVTISGTFGTTGTSRRSAHETTEKERGREAYRTLRPFFRANMKGGIEMKSKMKLLVVFCAALA